MCGHACKCAPDSASVCVCVCIFKEGRVILDRPECSQPISQHHCDIDLSARRQQGGVVGGWDGGLWEGAGGGRGKQVVE